MKKFKSIILLFITLFVVLSCDENSDDLNFETYRTDSVHFKSESYTILESSDEVVPVIAIYSSPNHDTDVTATFTVQGNAADYNLVNSENNFVFPAGVYSDTIFVSVNNNFDSDGDREILFVLESASNGANIGFSGPDALFSTFGLQIGDDDCPYTLEELGNATWSGVDNAPGSQAGPNSSQITSSYDNGTLYLEGIGYGWLTDPEYWDEVVVESYPVEVEISETGNITIPNQPLAITTWNGDVQPDYSIQGSGLYESCAGRMTINYDIYQNGAVLVSLTEVINIEN